MKWFISAFFVLAVAALGWWGWRSTSSSIAQPSSPVEPLEITFVCLETGTLSQGPRVATPAINPATGRATLVQALYCPECRRWRPTPPAAIRERMPLGPTCVDHKVPLLESAPADSAGGRS